MGKERDRLGSLKRSGISAATEETTSKDGKNDKKRKKVRNFRDAGVYEQKLSQAGIMLPVKVYVALVIAVSITAGVVAAALGKLLMVFIMVALSQYLFVGYLDDRAMKRKKQVIPHLAPFIDGIASALSTGFNIEQAIQHATVGIPSGLLRAELDVVVAALERGMTLNEAISLLRQRITGKEVTSLVVALTLFSSMGGSILEPFRRLARKIREQEVVVEKANRDLVMVKQAFYMLLILSFGCPVVLMFLQPDYLKNAFTDSLGRILIQFGVILNLTAIVIFKKLTSVRI